MESLNSLLAEAHRCAASEVLLMAGDAPAMRAPGPWERLNQGKSTPAEMESLVKELLSPAEWETLVQRREIEVEKVLASGGAVHCDIHFQRGSLVVILRPKGRPIG